MDLSRIINASIDAIITIDEKSRIILWNPAAERMFGYTLEEACRMTVDALMPDGYRQRHFQGVESFISKGTGTLLGRTVEVQGLKKDGTVFPAELSLAANETGGGWEFIGILRDITDRKEAEEGLASSNARLKQVNSELSVLFEVSRAISHTMELDALLYGILKTVTSIELFRLESRGGIFLVEGDGLVLKAHLGHVDGFVESHRGLKVGECLCGLAARSGEIVTSSDSGRDERHTIKYAGMEPHGHIVVPLNANEKVIGVLYLYLPPDTEIDAHHRELLSSIGNLLGVGINNALLYATTRSLSLKDHLTGLANRRLLGLELERNFSIVKRYGGHFSLLLLDIDFFKEYNDTRGHMEGDRLLVELSATIRSCIRDTDLAARFGGEEFMILMPETGPEMAAQAAERIRKAAKKTGITVSIGVAAYAEGMTKPEELVESADKALYVAKANGRDQVRLAPDTCKA